MPVIPAHGKWKYKDQEFKASLDDITPTLDEFLYTKNKSTINHIVT